MIKHIFVDPAIKSKKFVNKFLSNFKGKIEYSNFIPEGLDFKETIFITEKKGGFIKECPCSPNVVSCLYNNINIVEGCTLSCNYCAIDAYLDFPAIKVYSNLEDFEKELNFYLKRRAYVRIGTGELTDSLIWDNFFNYTEYLISLFSFYDSIIEFKTKTTNIDYFLNNNPSKNVLISWSVNTEKMIENEEKENSSLSERIEAIIKVYERGYKIGIHFDPVYYYEGCFEDYSLLINSILPFIKDRIGWVSVGGIRFNPTLVEKLYERKTTITSMEVLPSYYDGKLRLFYPLRIKLFKHIIANVKKYTSKVYLCMEPYFVWDELLLDYKSLNKRLYSDFFI